MQKKSNEEVISDFLKIGLILIDEYKSNSQNMKAYTKDGYIVYVNYKNIITKKQRYSIFSSSNPYTIQNIKLWLGRNMPHLDLLDGQNYTLSMDKLKFVCNVCNHIILKNWNSIQQKEGCPICSNRFKFTIKNIKEKLKILRPNAEILSTEYINPNEKLIVKCEKGHISHQSYSSLLGGSGCKFCYHERIKVERCGDGGSSWKGGITNTTEFFRNRISDWKNRSMKSCNYMCVITGRKMDVVHHVLSFNTILFEAHKNTKVDVQKSIDLYDENDLQDVIDELLRLHDFYGLGVCLSKEAHNEFHSIYGRGNNTAQQWNEFYRNKTIESQGGR